MILSKLTSAVVLKLLPWAALLVAAAGVAGFAYVAHLKSDIAHEQAEHAKTKSAFSEYRTDAHKKQLLAEQKQREIELHNFRNAERVAYEQTQREAVLSADLAALRSREQRVRNEFSAFRAATARDAERRDVAALAAKAATATELYEACGTEYRSMAGEAEQIRVQAVGLLEYIRGNPMCSTPFGQGASEPAK